MGKRKGFLSWWEFLIVIICFVLTPVVLNCVLFTRRASWVYGDGDIWLGFWGNYSGAFVGALVALWIANRQIKDSRETELEKEKRQRKTAQLQPLMIASNELKEIIFSLKKLDIKKRQHFESVKENRLEQKGGVELIEEESLEIKKEVESKVYKLRPINDNLIPCLHLIDNIELQNKLYSKVIAYQDFVNVLSIDVSSVELYDEMTIKEKQHFWELLDTTYIRTLDYTKELVDNEIKSLKEFVNKNFTDESN
ncbi:hypothetical protein EXW53_26790 (plasmid) [Bacillus mycoides]|uniref:hypothetical protein n=1 Tax=Bacillus mycoides TaxID=1405 RepID=UPI001C02F398|nr:hypothetical protein [Bacillus mycoides]QWH42884.1 hypothetical protein EXW53_26790 [Bacillus mycoides]